MEEQTKEVVSDEADKTIVDKTPKEVTLNVNVKELEFETEVDGEVAKMTLVDNDLYEKKAAENGISRDSLERLQKFDELYLSTMVKASGSASEKVFKDNDGVKVIDAEVPGGPQFEPNRKLGVREAARQSAKITTHIIKEKGNNFNDTIRPSVRVLVESPRYNLAKKEFRSIEDAIKEAVYSN